MSGIAGFIHFDGAPVEPGLVDRMTSAMAYRGPDGIRHWVNGSVALGQCMLRTTPESLEETQPLANEDESLILVMDGRVDNWEELRQELLGRGVILRNRSDAELVLRSYETWGADCLTHIDGDFALVVWDARQRAAFCARDRMGNKPFNYHWDGKTFAFASELQAILRLPWVRHELNEGMLAEYLAAEWYSRDETFWKGITRLVAAHCMQVSEAGPRTDVYWEPDLFATLPLRSDEDYVAYYRTLLFDAIRRMSRSAETVAVEVSGGLDSSAVYCVADELQKSGSLLAPDLRGYTTAFEDGSDADEIAYCRSVGAYRGRSISETPPSEMPLSWYSERAEQLLEFPGYPNGMTSWSRWEKARGDGSRVLLTGEAGDMWLGGTRTYYAEQLAAGRFGALLGSLKSDVFALGPKAALAESLRYGVVPLLPSAVQGGLTRLVRAARRGRRLPMPGYWLSERIKGTLEKRRVRDRQREAARVARIGQRAQLSLLSSPFIAAMTELIERNTSSVGLENRDPKGSSKMVQFAFSTPECIRRRGDINKFTHVQAMSGLMPEAVRNRRTKADFRSAFWRQLSDMEGNFNGESPSVQLGWVDGRALGDLFRRFQRRQGGGSAYWTLWNIYGCALFAPPAGLSENEWQGRRVLALT
jgi:asparagine synthase (glutamine-hydrolysing)